MSVGGFLPFWCDETKTQHHQNEESAAGNGAVATEGVPESPASSEIDLNVFANFEFPAMSTNASASASVDADELGAGEAPFPGFLESKS